MRFFTFTAFLLFCCLWTSCGSKYEGFHEVSEGLYRKVYQIGDEQYPLKKGMVAICDLRVLENGMQIFFDSNKAIYLDDEQEPFLTRVLTTMLKDDSACYVYEQGATLQYYCLKVLKLYSKKAYEDSLADYHLRSEQRELMDLTEYLNNSAGKWVSMLGLYVLDPETTEYVKLAKKGQIYTVHYKGTLLNGKVFDSTYLRGAPFTFKYGDPGQVLKGFEIAISRMKKGAKSKIILPSHLGFGEEGSSDGRIPPYTSLIYEIELINIENDTKTSTSHPL